MARYFARNFYQSAAWQQARTQAMVRDRGMCQSPGCFMPAQEVHHIIELTPENIHDPAIALSIDNLTCLCRDCHRRAHTHESESRYYFDSNGNVVPVP